MKYISQNNSIGANKSSDEYHNKRCFSANGFSLLPLALRPRLFCSVITAIVSLAIGLFMCSNPTFATDPFLNVTIANSITLDLKPISTAGTFAKSDTASSTISATTNYFAGYTLGIAASSNGADAANLLQTSGEGNEQTIIGRISSIGTVEGATSAGITEQAFSSSSNTQYNNTWGYMLTKLNTSESTNYLPAPTTTTPITLDATDTANPETANNYNIAIGARVDTEIPKGSYNNTFVIAAVANPIPYTINYDSNTTDTVTNMPTATSGSTTAATITNAINNRVPARTGYKFLGWCSVTTIVSGDKDTCSGTVYNPNGGGTNRNYMLDQTANNTNIVLYAMWQRVYNVTFVAGNNINSIMVADGSNNYKPQYAINEINNGSTTLLVPADTKLIVSVIPESDCILDSWSSNSNSTARLASTTLLTTTYTVGVADETLVATGIAADYTDPAKSYTTMKDLTLLNCSVDGTNVTDSRDGKSYTVKKIVSGETNFCFMLSNLRLDGGTILDSSTSNVSTEYTLSVDTGKSGWVNDYCRPYMASKNGEYYYNWPAATARVNDMTGASYCDNDATNSVGDICPANWRLPTYSDAIAMTLWDGGNNPGLLATTGNFYTRSQYGVGGLGSWWSSTWNWSNRAYNILFNGNSANYNVENKLNGLSVRCMRSS